MPEFLLIERSQKDQLCLKIVVGWCSWFLEVEAPSPTLPQSGEGGRAVKIIRYLFFENFLIPVFKAPSFGGDLGEAT